MCPSVGPSARISQQILTSVSIVYGLIFYVNPQADRCLGYLLYYSLELSLNRVSKGFGEFQIFGPHG